MTRLVLCRHGQSTANAGEWISGWQDVPLTEKGLREAKFLADRIGEIEGLDGIISSDLHRSVQTAEVIAKATGLTHIKARELRERNFGDWEGLTFKEVTRREPGWRDRIFSSPEEAPPGGETLEELASRVHTVLLRCRMIWPRGFIVCGHYCSLGAVLGILEGKLYRDDGIPGSPRELKIVEWPLTGLGERFPGGFSNT